MRLGQRSDASDRLGWRAPTLSLSQHPPADVSSDEHVLDARLGVVGEGGQEVPVPDRIETETLTPNLPAPIAAQAHEVGRLGGLTFLVEQIETDVGIPAGLVGAVGREAPAPAPTEIPDDELRPRVRVAHALGRARDDSDELRRPVLSGPPALPNEEERRLLQLGRIAESPAIRHPNRSGLRPRLRLGFPLGLGLGLGFALRLGLALRLGPALALGFGLALPLRPLLRARVRSERGDQRQDKHEPHHRKCRVPEAN